MNTVLGIGILTFAVGITALESDGQNVCHKVDVVTHYQTKVFYETKEEYYTTCCKRMIFCLKKCTKSRQVRITFNQLIQVPKLQKIYVCCKGWRRLNSARGCEIPICDGGCRIGKCIKPNQCSYNYDSSKGIERSLTDLCGKVINNTNGMIKVVGSNVLLETKVCHYKINIPQAQATRFQFERFHFNKNITCARSSVTLLEDNQTRYFFCVMNPPTSEHIVLQSRTITIEVVNSNWQPGDGFMLRFFPFQEV